MGKILVIAEKPSAGADMAKVLECNIKKDGYIEGENYVVTWALGHLIGLKYPEEHNKDLKEWKLETLPMIFDIKDSLKILPSTSKQFNVIKELLNREDIESIINAGDAGREGYLIQEWIYRMARNHKPKKVLWAASLTEEALKNSFANLKDPEEFDKLLLEAEARAEGDYLLGINYSRALTLTKSSGVILSYGRCQTPVLNLIVTRDREIENFVPVPFSNIKAKFDFNGLKYTGTLIDEQKNSLRLSKGVADSLSQQIKEKKATIKSYQIEEKRRKSPLLFDLTTLQKTMNSQYGYSAKETLEIAQKLYETHKVLSYPRTDSRYLTKDVFNEIEEHIKSCNFGEYKDFVTEVMKSPLEQDKHYINDLKVVDHHALIPTINNNIEKIYQGLSEKEKNVFDAVVWSLLAIFLPEYVYDKTTIITEVEKYLFYTSGITVKELGFKTVCQFKSEETKEELEETLPSLSEGADGKIEKIERKDYMTKPPSHYTASSILTAMEKYNIGTPATRAEILEKLQNEKRPYIVLEKKNYISTQLGRNLVDVVPEQLKSVELTAQFEEKLRKIKEGELKKEEFLQEVFKELEKNIAEFKLEPIQNKIGQERKSLGNCPLCKKGHIVNYPKGYSCDCYKEGCKFTIWKTIAGKSISETSAIQLLTKGKTELLKGFTAKSGKKFDARLAIKEDYSIGFEFNSKK